MADLHAPWFEEIRRIVWGVGAYGVLNDRERALAIELLCFANGRAFASWLISQKCVSRPREFGRRDVLARYLEITAVDIGRAAQP